MDPLSALLTAYLDGFSAHIGQQMQDVVGTEVQTEIVEYEGYRIPYQFQMWQIMHKSVCASYRLEIAEYSGCTTAAKELFGKMCIHLQENPKDHWSYKKLKNMYCSASANFEPAVATVGWSDQSPTDPIVQARQAGTLATAAALGENTAENHRRKIAACGEPQE